MKGGRTWVQEDSNQTSYSYVMSCTKQVDGMGLAPGGEVRSMMGVFLERKPVDLFAVGLRAGAGEAACACTVTWSLPQCRRSVDTCSLANCGLRKAALVEITSRSVNWGNLTGGRPMGEAGTLPQPRYR